jgi:agmatinase
MTYGGALSFLRRRYTREIDGCDVVVSGVPFDAGTSNRPGARFGPAGIRAASTQLAELAAFPWGFDPFDHLAVVDYGDCFLDFGYPGEVVEQVQKHARRILATGAAMLTFGGDHFITYPLLKAHAEVHGPLALVHFDAHPDTWSDDGKRLDHGSMFRRAVQEEIVDPAASVQIGIRTRAPAMGFTVLDAPWVHENGVAAVLQRIRETVGRRRAYLTFDIDCLDPAFAPGTGTPVVGGLSTAQALAILRGLGDIDLVGMDVVEVSPAYDHAEITSLAAATLAHDYLCLLAEKRRAAPDR